MRKIGFIQYKGRIKEILPHSYHIHSLSNRRKMFLSMLNTLLPAETRFRFSRCAKIRDDIYTILQDQVMAFLPFHRLRPEVRRPITTILIRESSAINRFLALSGTPRAQLLSASGYAEFLENTTGITHPAALIASLMVQENRLEMLMDLDELFAQTIFSRIKPQEGSTVSRDKNVIHIYDNGQVTRLLPRWKRVQPAMLSKQKVHIDLAFEEMALDPIDSYYLVYPKMDDFTRHIIVRNHDVGTVKIIPYSFTFCTKDDHVKSA